jgi:predicted nuclease of predicted toxin-antitoxin system
VTLRFLVDAQLPPALANWLRKRGHDADHVRDVMLGSQPDERIIAHAVKMGAVIITKDADFSHMSSKTPGCKVIWLRYGNSTSAGLLRSLEPVFEEIEQALADGQSLIEVRR